MLHWHKRVRRKEFRATYGLEDHELSYNLDNGIVLCLKLDAPVFQHNWKNKPKNTLKWTRTVEYWEKRIVTFHETIPHKSHKQSWTVNCRKVFYKYNNALVCPPSFFFVDVWRHVTRPFGLHTQYTGNPTALAGHVSIFRNQKVEKEKAVGTGGRWRRPDGGGNFKYSKSIGTSLKSVFLTTVGNFEILLQNSPRSFEFM